jgi:pimeloyl-ACP methyl ester carboxylesterase
VAGLTVPTLIVWGQQDRVIHVATAAILHQLMPASQVVIMRGIGHIPMLEVPRQSASEYLRFRAKLHDADTPALPKNTVSQAAGRSAGA